jgi:hypothetical protein
MIVGATCPEFSGWRLGHLLFAAGEAALVVVGAVLADMMLEAVPGKLLDDLFEHGSFVAHGVGSHCDE